MPWCTARSVSRSSSALPASSSGTPASVASLIDSRMRSSEAPDMTYSVLAGMPARRASTTGLRPVTISGPSVAGRRCGRSVAVDDPRRRRSWPFPYGRPTWRRARSGACRTSAGPRPSGCGSTPSCDAWPSMSSAVAQGDRTPRHRLYAESRPGPSRNRRSMRDRRSSIAVSRGFDRRQTAAAAGANMPGADAAAGVTRSVGEDVAAQLAGVDAEPLEHLVRRRPRPRAARPSRMCSLPM